MSDLLNKSLSDIQLDRNEKSSRRGGRSGSYRGGDRTTPYSRPPGSADDSKWKHDMYGTSTGGPDRSRPSGPTKPTNTLVIRHLHYEVTEAELKRLFEQVGPLKTDPKVLYDTSGRSRGLAFVTFVSLSHAVEALGEFNGAMAKGQRIDITYDRGPREGRADDEALKLASRLSGAKELISEIGGDSVRGKGRSRAPPPNAPSGPRRAGPVRSSVDGRDGRGRGGRDERGDRGGRGGRGPPRSADDLDNELEAFMKAPPSKNMSASMHAVNEADGDVPMEA